MLRTRARPLSMLQCSGRLVESEALAPSTPRLDRTEKKNSSSHRHIDDLATDKHSISCATITPSCDFSVISKELSEAENARLVLRVPVLWCMKRASSPLPSCHLIASYHMLATVVPFYPSSCGIMGLRIIHATRFFFFRFGGFEGLHFPASWWTFWDSPGKSLLVEMAVSWMGITHATRNTQRETQTATPTRPLRT